MLVQSAEKIILVLKSRRHLFLSSFSLDKYPEHRVGRVLSFFYTRWNWDSPTPLAAGERAPPPPPTFGLGGRAHSLAGEGLGESQIPTSDEGTYTVVLYIYIEVLCDPEEDPQKYNSPSRIYIVHCTVRQPCRYRYKGFWNNGNIQEVWWFPIVMLSKASPLKFQLQSGFRKYRDMSDKERKLSCSSFIIIFATFITGGKNELLWRVSWLSWVTLSTFSISSTEVENDSRWHNAIYLYILFCHSLILFPHTSSTDITSLLWSYSLLIYSKLYQNMTF